MATRKTQKSKVRPLIKKYGGKFVRFDKLPNEVQEHLRTRAAELGAIRTPQKYGLVRIPLRELIQLVKGQLVAYPLMLGGKQVTDFEEYHRWYQGIERRFVTRGSYDELWPITLEVGYVESDKYDECDVFQDGWHRFHAYVDRYHGNKLIPCLYGRSWEMVV
jgi:hypothetical protein